MRLNQDELEREVEYLRERLTAAEQRIEHYADRWQSVLDSEHRLSDAYVRLRVMLDAFDTPYAPTPEQIWAHTEAKLAQVISAATPIRGISANDLLVDEFNGIYPPGTK